MDERSKTFNECVRRGDFAGAALRSGALMKYARDARESYRAILDSPKMRKTAVSGKLISALGKIAPRALTGAGSAASSHFARDAIAGEGSESSGLSTLMAGLLGAAIGPKQMSSSIGSAARSVPLVMSPGLVSGTLDRMSGGEGFSSLSDKANDVAALAGTAQGMDPGEAMERIGRGAVRGTAEGLGDSEILQETLKDMGVELGAGAVGGLAGTGIGHLVADRIYGDPSEDFDLTDPNEMDDFMADRERRMRNKAAITALLGAAGGVGGISLKRYLD